MGGCCGKGGAKKHRKSSYDELSTNEVQNALLELMNTERSYGADLKCMTNRYLDAAAKEEIFFDNTDLIAFNCVTLDLAQMQDAFQQRLEKAMGNVASENADFSNIICEVANEFSDSESAFDHIYCRYILCMSRVQKIVSKSAGIEKIVIFFEKKFNEFSAELMAEKKRPDNLDKISLKRRIQPMEALLVRPFQRVMLYPLILERIQKHCQDGTGDKAAISKAIESIKNLGTHMNETLKLADVSNEAYQMILKDYGILEHKK